MQRPSSATDSRATFAIDAGIVVLAATARIAIEFLRGLQHGASDIGTMFVPNMRWWWNRPHQTGGWNPWVFGGYPADGDPLIGQLHPLGLLYAMAPPFTAAAIEAVLVPALAGIGMLVYLRRLGCARWASLAGALSFSLGGFVAANSVHPPHLRTVAAIPWALAAIECLEGRALIGGLGVAVAAMIAGGHPQTVAYSLAIVVVYPLACAAPLTPRRAATLAAGLALGIGLTASAWLPAAQLIGSSTLAGGSGHLVASSPSVVHEPDRLASLRLLSGLLVPFAAGGAATPPYGPSPWQSRCGVVECAGYPGMLGWLALLAGIPVVVRERRGRFWLALALVGVVLSTGALGEVPPIRGVRAPARFLLWWNLGVSVAAALALQAAATGRSRARSWCVSAGLIAVLLWLAGLGHVVAGRLVRVMGVWLLLSGASAVTWLRGWRFAGWVVVGVLAADLVVFDAALPGGSPPDRPRQAIELMRGLGREQPGSDLDRMLIVPLLRDANWAFAAHARLVQGFNALVPQNVAALLGEPPGSQTIGMGLVIDPRLASPASHVLDLLRCRVIAVPARASDALSQAIAQGASDGVRGLERSESDVAGFDVYLNQRVRPVAWLVHDVRILSEDAILRLIRGEAPDATFDPARQALAAHRIPGIAAAPGERADESVAVLRYDDDEIRLLVSAASAALLVLSELAYPGWTAAMDGRDVPVETVNAGFRAVVVPEGRHQVVVSYRPRSRRIGVWIGGASLVAFVALALARFARRPTRGG